MSDFEEERKKISYMNLFEEDSEEDNPHFQTGQFTAVSERPPQLGTSCQKTKAEGVPVDDQTEARNARFGVTEK